MRINLSDSEWKLMNRLWDHSPMTITELTAALRNDTGRTKNTVITMLARLEAKRAVRHEEGVRAKHYYPLPCPGGRRRLTEADIAELSAILAKAGGNEA